MYPEKMQKGLAISKGVWYNSFRCQKGSKSYAPVAQLDSATDSDSVGHWFESSRAYHQTTSVKLVVFSYATNTPCKRFFLAGRIPILVCFLKLYRPVCRRAVHRFILSETIHSRGRKAGPNNPQRVRSLVLFEHSKQFPQGGRIPLVQGHKLINPACQPQQQQRANHCQEQRTGPHPQRNLS